MNDKRLIRFRQLVDTARREAIPPLDVTRRVLEHLGARTVQPATDWVLLGAALCSLAAAAAVMLLASQQGALSTDSLAELVRPFTPVIQ